LFFSGPSGLEPSKVINGQTEGNEITIRELGGASSSSSWVSVHLPIFPHLAKRKKVKDGIFLFEKTTWII